jgi:DNA invertase Pin-like site-specific DNA recombinase
MTKVKKVQTEKQPATKSDLIYDPTMFKTKSEAIRTFAAQGHSRADIARSMGILYQHVRNVLTAPVKKGQQ